MDLFPIILTNLVEALLIILISLGFFGLISLGTLFIHSKVGSKGKMKSTKRLLMTLSASMIAVQLIGTAVWRLGIENKLVDEADSWILFLTYFPLTWSRVFEETSVTFHEPLSPFFTTGQVATLHTSLALLLIALGTLVPIAFKRVRQIPLQERLTIASLFFLLQIIWLGIAGIATLV
jgi:hypothetical protein